jgi:hypothetical protein
MNNKTGSNYCVDFNFWTLGECDCCDYCFDSGKTKLPTSLWAWPGQEFDNNALLCVIHIVVTLCVQINSKTNWYKRGLV